MNKLLEIHFLIEKRLAFLHEFFILFMLLISAFFQANKFVQKVVEEVLRLDGLQVTCKLVDKLSM